MRTAGRAAIISAAATSASGKVARRQQQKFAAQDAAKAIPAHRSSKAGPAAGNDLISSLQQLAELRAAGVLNEKEFTAAKGKLLAR